MNRIGLLLIFTTALAIGADWSPQLAAKYLDSSFESRFLAVNVLDVQLDEATKMHFIARAQGSFWTMYQQLKGWRACLVGILQELGR